MKTFKYSQELSYYKYFFQIVTFHLPNNLYCLRFWKQAGNPPVFSIISPKYNVIRFLRGGGGVGERGKHHITFWLTLTVFSLNVKEPLPQVDEVSG